RQRHEADRQKILAIEASLAAPQPDQLLVTRPDRDDQAPSWLQLREELVRHLARRGGDQDGVERSRLGPSTGPVADADGDVRAAGLLEPGARGLGKLGPGFDGVHVPHQTRQDRRLVARAGPNPEDRAPGLRAERPRYV